jgi:Iap family predicted aminopeptidase
MTPGSMGTSTGISSVNIGTEVAGISSVTISSTSEMTSTEVETTSSEVEVATVDTADTSIMTASTTVASSSDTTSSSSSITITPMPGLDGQPQMAMADVQVQDMQGKIDASVSGVMTASEADQIADQIVAQNIEDQQGQMEEQLQQTGQYADESTLIAYLGYNPGFADYYNQSIPNKSDWYESREIYANVVIVDNVPAYYSLAGDNINTLNTMISQQPILYGGTL